jgi:hypothetical protein
MRKVGPNRFDSSPESAGVLAELTESVLAETPGLAILCSDLAL